MPADSERFVAALESALETNLISDAAVAQSDNDRRAFWSLRDDVAQVVVGGMPVVFDISLPLGAMEQYVDTLGKELRGRSVTTNSGSLVIWEMETCMFVQVQPRTM
jgi:hypothetical protein